MKNMPSVNKIMIRSVESLTHTSPLYNSSINPFHEEKKTRALSSPNLSLSSTKSIFPMKPYLI
jgi:hypothetical protein